MASVYSIPTNVNTCTRQPSTDSPYIEVYPDYPSPPGDNNNYPQYSGTVGIVSQHVKDSDINYVNKDLLHLHPRAQIGQTDRNTGYEILNRNEESVKSDNSSYESIRNVPEPARGEGVTGGGGRAVGGWMPVVCGGVIILLLAALVTVAVLYAGGGEEGQSVGESYTFIQVSP